MKTKKKTEAPEAFVAAIIPTENYLVTRDDKPCTLINVSGMRKGGVCIPGSPIVMFAKHRDAERAVERTVSAREKLRGSLVSEWLREQIPSFLDGRRFAVVPAGHQGGDPRLQAKEKKTEAIEA